MENPDVIFEKNKLIAAFMGYTYFHPGVDIDHSDIGGLYERFPVYSKVPIETSEWPEDDQYYFKDLPNPDYKKKNPVRWASNYEFIGWDCVNSGKYLTELKYHSSWDWIMEVIEKIESIGDSQDMPPFDKNYHIQITKRHTRVIRDWDTFLSNRAMNSVEMDDLSASFSDYRHIIFDSKLHSTYHAVVDFIEWYNEKYPTK